MNAMEALLQEVTPRIPAGTIVEAARTILWVNPDHRNALFRELREHGYGIRKVPRAHGGGWYAKLREDVCARKGKCGYCNALIDDRGIFTHGRHCESCGKLICEEYVDGEEIEFFFASDRADGWHRRITMLIKYFDQCAKNKNAGELVLYAEPVDGRPGFSSTAVRAKEILADHGYEFRRFSEMGVDYIGILFERCMIRVIHTTHHLGGWRRASIVKVYKGKEYRDILGHLPVPEGITIHDIAKQ